MVLISEQQINESVNVDTALRILNFKIWKKTLTEVLTQ